MSQVATQHRIWAILSAGLGGAGCLALPLFSAGSIGFPDGFLIWSSSVVQGITIASTLIFIAASGFLITTHPQPLRTASVVGAIVTLGGAVAVCCLLIAPGITPAVTAGITYCSAFVFVSAALSRASTEAIKPNNDKSPLLLKPITWFALGLLGVFWLAIILFKEYGPIAAFWLFCAPLIPCSVWFSFAFIKQAFNRSRFYKLSLVLFSICLLVVVLVSSGARLRKEGALIWAVEIIVLAFAILTALLLNLYVTPALHRRSSQIEVQPTPSPYKSFGFMLPFIIVFGLWGYSDYFSGGITVTERLNSLSSATSLDKILGTQLSSIRITISPDEHFLANGGENNSWGNNREKAVELWDLKTGMLTHTFSGYSDPLIVNDRSSQPILLMHNPAGHVEQWNLINNQQQQGSEQDEKLLLQQTQRRQAPLPSFLPRDAVLLASSTDGKTIATVSDYKVKQMSNAILIWDTPSGKLLYSLSPAYYGNVAAFSPSGHLLASDPGCIHLWRLSRH